MCPLEGQFGVTSFCGRAASPRGRFVTVTVPSASGEAGRTTSIPLWNGWSPK